MLKLRALVELRGIENKVNTKTGAVYYVLNVEDEDGTAHQFYCSEYNALQTGLKKGDMVDLVLEYKKFGREVSLKVHSCNESDSFF